MNTENWSKAWVKGANDLTRLWAYLSLLEEPRHHIYKSMPVWKIFGTFACGGWRGCGRAWTSTDCVVEFSYRYNYQRGRGEVLLVREFGQECRSCGALRYPKFDDESAAKTVGKVVERILKVFYGIQSTEKFVNPISGDVHSTARPRNYPHNSERCEACSYGLCFYDNKIPTVVVTSSTSLQAKRDRLEGPRARIPWSLRVMLKRRVLCQKMVSPRDDPLDILAEDLKKCQLEDESHEVPTVISQLSNSAVTKFSGNSTDTDKLLATALVKLALIKPEEMPKRNVEDSNANVDYSYYNYYY